MQRILRSISRRSRTGKTGNPEAHQKTSLDAEADAERNPPRTLRRCATVPARRCNAEQFAGGNCSALHCASSEGSARSKLVYCRITFGQNMLTQEDRIRLIHENRTVLLNPMFDELCRKAAN